MRQLLTKGPTKIVPLVMIDKRHLMVLSSRRWKPEPHWCRHGWRTWVMPLPKDSTKGIRFHGQEEDFGVLLELKPRCVPTDAPRQRTRPKLERRFVSRSEKAKKEESVE